MSKQDQDHQQDHQQDHHLVINAFEMLGDIEAALDQQIYPEQAKDVFDAPDNREYHIVLTAAQWRRFGAAMALLDTAARSQPR